MGFVLFGFLSSPIYISNSVYFGSPLPPGSGTMTSVKWVDQIGVVKYLSINMVRWAYQAVDFSAVPNPVGGLAFKLKASLVRGFANLIHFNFEGSTASMDGYQFSWASVFPLQEDVAWYGLVGAFLVVPFSIAAFVVGLRKKQYLFSLPLIFLVTSSITCAFIRPGWTPYDGRYFLPVAAIATACFPLVLRKNRISWWIQFIVVVLSACSIAMVLVYNPAKQVVGGSAVWGMNRIDLLTRQTYESKEMLYLVESAVPADAVLGVAARGETIPEYGLFGEKFTRRILEIMDPVMLENAGWLERQGIKYILVYSPAGSPQRIPPGFHYFDSLKDWIVYSNQ
jgi:hypothetical protein